MLWKKRLQLNLIWEGGVYNGVKYSLDPWGTPVPSSRAPCVWKTSRLDNNQTSQAELPIDLPSAGCEPQMWTTFDWSLEVEKWRSRGIVCTAGSDISSAKTWWWGPGGKRGDSPGPSSWVAGDRISPCLQLEQIQAQENEPQNVPLTAG